MKTKILFILLFLIFGSLLFTKVSAASFSTNSVRTITIVNSIVHVQEIRDLLVNEKNFYIPSKYEELFQIYSNLDDLNSIQNSLTVKDSLGNDLEKRFELSPHLIKLYVKANKAFNTGEDFNIVVEYNDSSILKQNQENFQLTIPKVPSDYYFSNEIISQTYKTKVILPQNFGTIFTNHKCVENSNPCAIEITDPQTSDTKIEFGNRRFFNYDLSFEINSSTRPWNLSVISVLLPMKFDSESFKQEFILSDLNVSNYYIVKGDNDYLKIILEPNVSKNISIKGFIKQTFHPEMESKMGINKEVNLFNIDNQSFEKHFINDYGNVIPYSYFEDQLVSINSFGNQKAENLQLKIISDPENVSNSLNISPVNNLQERGLFLLAFIQNLANWVLNSTKAKLVILVVISILVILLIGIFLRKRYLRIRNSKLKIQKV